MAVGLLRHGEDDFGLAIGMDDAMEDNMDEGAVEEDVAPAPMGEDDLEAQEIYQMREENEICGCCRGVHGEDVDPTDESKRLQVKYGRCLWDFIGHAFFFLWLPWKVRFSGSEAAS